MGGGGYRRNGSNAEPTGKRGLGFRVKQTQVSKVTLSVWKNRKKRNVLYRESQQRAGWRRKLN